MILTTSENSHRKTTITSTEGQHSLPTIQPYSSIWKNLKLMSCRFIRSALQNQGVSQSACARIHPQLLEPWNPEKISNLLEQMARLYLRTICQSVKPFHPPVNKDLDFLLKFYEQGLGGSGINTARCALSSLITLEGNMTIGKHLLVQRFIKGVF